MAKQLGRLAAILAGLLLATAAPAGAATTWTPIASGTTQDITAIDYQSDSAAWFATSNGQIFYANGSGGFTLGGSFPGNSFDDIAFQPGGNIGYAVTVGGHAYRSIDGGHSWSLQALPGVHSTCGSGILISVPRLNAVVWADASTAYLVGGSAGTEPVVLKTTNATTASISLRSTTTARHACSAPTAST